MSFIRVRLRSLLSQHVLVFGWRWIALGLGMLFLAFWPPVQSVLPALPSTILAVLLAVGSTALLRRYLRALPRFPMLAVVDLLLSVALIALTGGAGSPWVLFGYAALLGPALVFSWRGGVLAGLLFGVLDLLALRFLMLTPAAGAATDLGWQTLRFVTPALIGLLLPLLVSYLSMQLRAPIRAGTDPLQPAEARLRGLGALEELPSQPLSAVSTRREIARARASADVTPAPLITTADSSVQAMRKAIVSITPGSDVELPVALDRLAAQFGTQSGLLIRTQLLGRARPIPPAAHAALLKLAQEALLNVQQHARAHSVALTLRYESQLVDLLIQDDGVGLLDGTHERPGMHGLRAARYRLVELDGMLEVSEGDSGGLRVRGRVPIE